jgi:hypothetical protein
LGKSWQKLGKSWQKLAKVGKSWQKLAKVGESWRKLAKVGKSLGLLKTLMFIECFRVSNNFNTGANPTIASYNASAVKIYNATSSLLRFENENNFYKFEKRTSLLQRWRCSCKFLSRRIGSRTKDEKDIQTDKQIGLATCVVAWHYIIMRATCNALQRN